MVQMCTFEDTELSEPNFSEPKSTKIAQIFFF